MRIAALSLAAAVALGALACGSREPQAATEARATTATTAPAGPSVVDVERLPELALSGDDLPAGFTVRREGFVPAAGDVVGGFRRSFDPGAGALGESTIADLTSDVALFRSDEAAGEALGVILAALTGEQVEAAFAELIRNSVGIEATDLAGQTIGARGLGDAAVVAEATFDTNAGRAEAIFVVVLVGRLHHALFLIGPPGEVRPDDAASLTRDLVPRLRQAFAGELAA